MSRFAGTQEIITSRGEHRGPNLMFMSLKHSPLLPASRFSITPLNSGSIWAKMIKSPKIRYKSVITQKSVVKINSPPMCYGQFATFRTRACFVHVLHAVEVAHPVFFAPNRYFTGIFNYLPLYWGTDRPDSMLYYPISCCGSIATLPEPHFLLLPTVTCVQSDHVPKSPAEISKTQLWTLITFFWLGSLI